MTLGKTCNIAAKLVIHANSFDFPFSPAGTSGMVLRPSIVPTSSTDARFSHTAEVK